MFMFMFMFMFVFILILILILILIFIFNYKLLYGPTCMQTCSPLPICYPFSCVQDLPPVLWKPRLLNATLLPKPHPFNQPTYNKHAHVIAALPTISIHPISTCILYHKIMYHTQVIP